MKLFALLAAAASAEFNSQPTGGQRVCEYYTLKAKAIFDNGFTEDVGAAMYDGASKVSSRESSFLYKKVYLRRFFI